MLNFNFNLRDNEISKALLRAYQNKCHDIEDMS